jgi:cytochrome c oxidase cbb3-type subunit 1
MWRELEADGTLANSFVQSLEAMKPYYIVRFLGGVLYLAGFLVMVYNVVKTIMGPSAAPVTEQPQTA